MKQFNPNGFSTDLKELADGPHELPEELLLLLTEGCNKNQTNNFTEVLSETSGFCLFVRRRWITFRKGKHLSCCNLSLEHVDSK